MSTEIRFENNSAFHIEVFWINFENQETKYASLAPFEAYTQQTYEGHAWVMRDAVSGVMLGQSVGQSEPSFARPEIAPRSENSDTPVSVTFQNQTLLAIEVAWIDYSGNLVPYQKLLPGASFTQSTYAGHPWAFVSQHSGTVVSKYIPSTEAEQVASVALHSRLSETQVTLGLRNATPLRLSLEWIDFDGKPVPYQTVAPGEIVHQETYRSHPWILRDQHSGSIVELYPSFDDNSEVVFDGKGLRSVAGLAQVDLVYRNQLPFSVDVDWLDFAGEPKRYATLASGEAFSISTYRAHPWRFSRVDTGETVDLFLAGDTKSQAHEVAANLLSGDQIARFTLTNTLLLDMDVCAQTEDGTSYLLGRLSNGETDIFSVLPDAPIQIKDHASGHILREFAASDDAEVVLDAKDVRSSPSSTSCSVRFTNDTPVTIEVIWVDFQGKESVYATLKPGHAYTQQTLVHHAWRAREKHSKRLVGLYVANAETAQTASFRMASKNSARATGITFVNDTILALDIYWMDYEGKEVHYKTLGAQGTVGFSTYQTHPWIVRDRQSGRVLDWAFGNLQDQTVRINTADIKPLEGDKAVTVKFANRLPWAVELFWINYEGHEISYGTLEPGQEYAQQTFATHPWRIRQRHTGEEIGLYISRNLVNQRHDIRLKSENSDVATSIKFVNASPLSVGVYWVDYNGREVQYATIEPRDSYEQSTYMTHPWVLRDMASGEAVGFTVGLRDDQDFWTTGAGINSPKNTKQVALKIRNTTRRRIDMKWVNYDGEEVAYGTLEPGVATNMTTGASHTWRFRDHDTQVEVDLYIATKRKTQTCRITDRMVRVRERAHAELWPGEVALYEFEDFGGRVWIAHHDLPDFTKIHDLNDRIRSIRLGPETAVTLFQHVRSKGINDVLYNDVPNLGITDIGNNQLSSLEILNTAPLMANSISATARVTKEFDTGTQTLMERTVLRTIISVPPSTGEIDVWATEEALITVNGRSHRIDPVKSARLKPNATGKLVVTMPPDSFGSAVLMLRTDAMAPAERFFVFADADVHTKILSMDKDALWENRSALGFSAASNKSDMANVSQALKSLSATVPAASRSLAQGQNRDRHIIADRMPYGAWRLNMGGTGADFSPMAVSEAMDATKDATRIDTQIGQWDLFNKAVGWADDNIAKPIDNFVVKEVPKAATTAVKETKRFAEDDVGGFLQDAGDTVVKVTKPIAKDVKRELTKGAKEIDKGLRKAGDFAEDAWKEGTHWAENAADDAKTFVEDTADDAIKGGEKLISDAGDTLSEVVEDVTEELDAALDKVIEITVTVADKAYTFIADTVEIVGKFLQKVVEQVGILWDKFTDWLADVFGWDDILRTHDFVVSQIEKGFDTAIDMVRTLDQLTGQLFDYLQDEVVSGVDNMIDQLGGGDIASKNRDGGIDRSEISDKIDWIMALVVGPPDEGPSDPAQPVPNELRDRMTSMIPDSVKTTLTRLLQRLVDELKDFVENDLGVVIDSFLDSIALFEEAIDHPDKALEMILSGLLSLMKGALVGGIGVIKIIVGVLFEIFLIVIETVKSAMMSDLDIPILSDLYKTLTGRSLSVVSLLAFAVGIPATVLAKSITGEAPFKSQTAIGQSMSDSEKQSARANRDWAIVYGVCHLILNVIDVTMDVQSATTSSKTVTKKKTVVKKNSNGQVVSRKQVPGRTKTKYMSDLAGFDDANANPKSQWGKGMTTVQYLGVAALFLAQVSGNPTGHAGGISPQVISDSINDAKEEGDRAGKVSVMAHVVWGWQWLYVVLAGIDVIGSTNESFRAGGSGLPDKVMPVATTVVGIVHLVMMSVLVGFDAHYQNHAEGDDKHRRAINDRRRYGWMCDTFPAVTKVCAIRELNTSTYYIPLAVHTILMTTIIGHLSEAIVYFARADEDIEAKDFDL